jgi:hypothetical membrane protein
MTAWWARVSSAVAPVALIGGWTLAASRQPGGFDSVRDTISALAAHGATDRWIMTSGIAAVGVCHVVTAAGIPTAHPVGRITLAAGGVASVLVAAYPQRPDASVPAHAAVAGISFVALTAWPVLASRADGPGLLRRGWSAAATGLLTSALVWFAFELDDGSALGLSERVLAGAQALWPLALITSLPRVRRS